MEEKKLRTQAREPSLATRRERLSDFMKHLKALPPGEQIPVAYVRSPEVPQRNKTQWEFLELTPVAPAIPLPRIV